jgi:tricorn protease
VEALAVDQRRSERSLPPLELELGVVGIEGDKPFVDGGMATQPGWGHWTPSRGYAMENQGVAPDIEVEITPADRAAGRDPQLDKAIETLAGKLPAKRFVPPRPETQPPTSPTR